MENNSRHISKPYPIELYELLAYDGGDGRTNQPTGFVTSRKSVAEEWQKSDTGRSYSGMSGICISRLEDMPPAAEALARMKALAKLTPEEKKLLGLN